jgi:hypothetical protein
LSCSPIIRTLPPSMSRVSGSGESLGLSHPYRPSRSVTGQLLPITRHVRCFNHPFLSRSHKTFTLRWTFCSADVSSGGFRDVDSLLSNCFLCLLSLSVIALLYRHLSQRQASAYIAANVKEFYVHNKLNLQVYVRFVFLENTCL